jgi:hypothetical protein
MVSVGYMIGNPGPPSAFRHYVNRHVIPPAIDAAGAVETAVHELGERVRAQPKTCLLAAATLGLLFGATIFALARE